jgi:hypothetical protein
MSRSIEEILRMRERDNLDDAWREIVMSARGLPEDLGTENIIPKTMSFIAGNDGRPGYMVHIDVALMRVIDVHEARLDSAVDLLVRRGFVLLDTSPEIQAIHIIDRVFDSMLQDPDARNRVIQWVSGFKQSTAQQKEA